MSSCHLLRAKQDFHIYVDVVDLSAGYRAVSKGDYFLYLGDLDRCKSVFLFNGKFYVDLSSFKNHMFLHLVESQ